MKPFIQQWINFPRKHPGLKYVLIASITAFGLWYLLANQSRRHPGDRLPHVLLIGARKCGTGSFINFLGRHPSIARRLDAAHFFDNRDIYSKGLDWYRRFNNGRSDQLAVEGTPDYFQIPAAPLRIKQMNESIRLLLILRDPVVRLISDYTMVNMSGSAIARQYISSRHMPDRNAPVSAGMFPDINSVMLDQNGDVDGTLQAVQVGMYANHLERYLSYFKMEQIHVVDGDIFSKSPWTELSAVENFLGIKHNLTENKFHFSTEKGFYCHIDTNGCTAKSKGVPHPNVDSNVIAKLKEFYRPYNDRLFNILNRKFDW